VAASRSGSAGVGRSIPIAWLDSDEVPNSTRALAS
jgi:hypothetical protein